MGQARDIQIYTCSKCGVPYPARRLFKATDQPMCPECRHRADRERVNAKRRVRPSSAQETASFR